MAKAGGRTERRRLEPLGLGQNDGFHASLMLLVIGTVVHANYLRLGPGWFREDFYSLANAKFGGGTSAAGPAVSASRPLTATIYSFVFGVLGSHPAIVYALLAATLTANSILIVALLRRHFPCAPSVAVGVMYLVLPTQGSISHWASTINVALALTALLTGLLLVERDNRWVLGGLAAGIGVLAYEAVAPLAVGAWILYWLRRRPSPWRPLLALATTTAPAIRVVMTSPRTDDVVLFRLGDGINSLFGWGLTPWDPVWRILVSGTAVGLLWLGSRLILRQETRTMRGPEILIVVGVSVIGVAWSPFYLYGYDMDFLGQGDRANFAAVIGGATVLTSIGWGLVRLVPEPGRVGVVAALSLVLAAIVLPSRADDDLNWHRAWTESRRSLSNSDRSATDPELVIVDECPIVVGGVVGFQTVWDTTHAVRWYYEDPGVGARCGVDGEVTSLPPSPASSP